MRVLFSDLDGTLLDHATYSWEPAAPALDLLRQRGIPLVLATSKTRAEVEFWRERLGNTHPFIVENGGAVFVPSGYFPFRLPFAERLNGYDVIEIGDRYERLVAALRAAAAESGVRVRGFHEMSDTEVAQACGLPLDQARLARRREYDEPFEIADGQPAGPLLRTIEKRGFRWTCGGRFHHITGKNDKAAAVKLLRGFYAGCTDTVLAVGLGDGWNDVPLLNAVDVPVVIGSPSADAISKEVPRARVTRRSGPEGWNDAVLELLAG